MSPENGFLDSIREDLDDDATKLIFSDWLEENEDWRGHLLRMQVERNRHPFWTTTFKLLHQQMVDLLHAKGEAWIKPLSEYSVRYSDGTGLLWLRMPPHQLARLPEPRTSQGVHRWITEVSLDGGYVNDVLEALDRGPDVRVFLNFSRSRSQNVGNRLASSPHLDRVRSLDLTFSSFHRQDLEALLGAPHLASLQYLFFGFSSGVGIVPGLLVTARHLTNLRGLDLAGCGLKDSHVEQLARAPALEGLSALYLEQNLLGKAGVEALTQSRYLQKLRVLDLRRCGISRKESAGIQLLKRFPFATL